MSLITRPDQEAQKPQNHDYAEQQEIERAALIELYNATHGKQWRWRDNWCTPRPVETWMGVKIDFEGTVTAIELAQNNLCGCIPASIASFSRLTILNLSGNGTFDRRTQASTGGLGGKPPWRLLLEMKTLEVLTLGDISGGNHFTASEIPRSIGSLTNLKELGLAHCNLRGELPRELSRLSSLERLDVSENKLEGPIPWKSLLEGCIFLKHLILQESHPDEYVCNDFEPSELPAAIGNLECLETIQVPNCNIQGQIPATITQLSVLRRVYLNSNNLSGQLPASLGSSNVLPHLRTLDVSDNPRLGGPLAPSLCDNPFVSTSGCSFDSDEFGDAFEDNSLSVFNSTQTQAHAHQHDPGSSMESPVHVRAQKRALQLPGLSWAV